MKKCGNIVILTATIAVVIGYLIGKYFSYESYSCGDGKTQTPLKDIVASSTNPTAKWLYAMFLQRGWYPREMLEGCDDVRQIIRRLRVTSYRAEVAKSSMLVKLDELYQFYFQNGIYNPNVRTNLTIAQVAPLREMTRSIRTNLEVMIRLTSTREIA